MQRALIMFLMGLTLILWPPIAGAGETRVSVSITLGSAVIVGGGLLIFSLTYAARVSQNEPAPQTHPTPWIHSSLNDASGQRGTIAARLLIEERPEPVPPMPLELPLLLFRW